ncbi:MAG: hypothetical protein QW086_01920, partial [Pyrobaculum sp.]
MKVAVVATWGLPLMWRRVKYLVPKLPSKLCGRPSDYSEVALEREGYSSTAETGRGARAAPFGW